MCLFSAGQRQHNTCWFLPFWMSSLWIFRRCLFITDILLNPFWHIPQIRAFILQKNQHLPKTYTTYVTSNYIYRNTLLLNLYLHRRFHNSHQNRIDRYRWLKILGLGIIAIKTAFSELLLTICQWISSKNHS